MAQSKLMRRYNSIIDGGTGNAFTGAFLSSLTGVHHHPVPTVATQLLIAA
jgi:hypothetical protein